MEVLGDIMFPMSWTRVAFLGVLAFVIAGCKGSGHGLAGSQDGMSICPPGGCSDLAPDVTQLSLTYRGRGTIIQQAATTPIDQIEIGGDCYTSTYPDNRIEVAVYMAGTRVTLGTQDIVSTLSGQTSPKCKDGRFGFSVNGARLLGGQVYRLDVALVAVDSDSREFRNPGYAVFSVNVSR